MKYFINIALLFLPSIMVAQFSAQSDLTLDYGQDANIQGIDAIVVFEELTDSAILSFEFEDSISSAWYYRASTMSTVDTTVVIHFDSLIVSSVLNDTITNLDSLQQGLYELRLDDTSYYYSVIDFSEFQGYIDTVWVDDSGDSCNFVRLYSNLVRQDIPVYDLLNDSLHFLTDAETEFLWTNELDEIQTPEKQSAPFEDVVYACAPFSDDFFSSNDLVVNYPSLEIAFSDVYTAVAVQFGSDPHIDAEIPTTEGFSNVSTSSSATEGSAPLNVTYTVVPEGNNAISSWWVWNIDNTKPGSATYRYQNQITHSFVDYAENGYRVQVIIDNGYCQVTDSTEVMVTVSSLTVPNILYLGFGAEGKFKVSYQSLDPDSFKAAIYDRNGRLVYKWDDPSGGWDGRSPVTGAYVSTGAYYFSIQAKGTDGIEYKEIGDVNVIREKGI